MLSEVKIYLNYFLSQFKLKVYIPCTAAPSPQVNFPSATKAIGDVCTQAKSIKGVFELKFKISLHVIIC